MGGGGGGGLKLILTKNPISKIDIYRIGQLPFLQEIQRRQAIFNCSKTLCDLKNWDMVTQL